jgi:ubiquinone/menaquinone biosynthesis C-methylase UbiE
MRDPSDAWTGIAGSYDRTRPAPPPALPDLLTQLIRLPGPGLVVDLGSGTGLSTVIWAERAERVIGIEPNADMRHEAACKVEGYPFAARIEYRGALAHSMDLPAKRADIATAAHSFH